MGESRWSGEGEACGAGGRACGWIRVEEARPVGLKEARPMGLEAGSVRRLATPVHPSLLPKCAYPGSRVHTGRPRLLEIRGPLAFL